MLSTKINELSQLLDVKTVERHEKCLELPTLTGRSKKQIFSFVWDHVEEVEGLERKRRSLVLEEKF